MGLIGVKPRCQEVVGEIFSSGLSQLLHGSGPFLYLQSHQDSDFVSLILTPDPPSFTWKDSDYTGPTRTIQVDIFKVSLAM